ncbi:MAG TPA: hypothetical protein PL001_11545 [Candidatus Kryptobacter bacterium]|nr:MAG: hypothetical protein B7Z63_01065 [Ignavibacteriae bacterium 37-53-5]HQT92646.1 hypothetical protein [Candidatus Kryptobacter bacterium]
MSRRFVAIASFLVVFALAVSCQQVAYGQVTSPANNSFLVAGSNQEISWNVTGDASSIVVLQYTTNGGATWNSIAPSGMAAGSYNWVIPVGTNSYLCKVRIVRYTSKGLIPVATTGNFSIANLNPYSQISAVFSHRVIALTDTTGHHFNRLWYFK